MTRLEQFQRRRERYLNRRHRAYQDGFVWHEVEISPGVFRSRRSHRYRPLDTGPLQFKGHLSKLHPKARFTLLPGPFAFPWLITFPSRGHPPHAKFTGPWLAFKAAHPNFRWRVEIIGFQHRKVHARKKRAYRMTGPERRIWGASKCAMYYGFFPDWDPLARHPTHDDLLHGDPPYDGPFPGVPGRLNTPA